MRGRGAHALIERELEIGELVAGIGGLAAGTSTVIGIEGAPGIGKSALVEVVVGDLGADPEYILCAARCCPFEQSFPFGTVRQLFEPVLAMASAADRAACLAGVAALASAIVDPQAPRRVDRPLDVFGAQHALYWLVANMAARRRLVIAVDDLQWCDQPSLRFLLYLTRRAAGLPSLVVLARRTGAGAAPMLDELWARHLDRTLRPAPLSVSAVATLVGTGLGAPTDPAFARACHVATGGNPLFVEQIVRSFRARRTAPTAAATPEVASIGPDEVATEVIRRIGPDPAARQIAEAVAVLGDDTDVRTAALLAALPEATAVDAAERLAAVGVLRIDEHLTFAHPIVRSALYGRLSAPRRRRDHGEAARILRALEGDSDRVAAHLLRSSPTGDPADLRTLEAAARRALATGAPEGAAPFLARAVQEPLAEAARAALLADLGTARLACRDQRAEATLREALTLTADAVARARITLALCALLVTTGIWTEIPTLVAAALADLGPGERELTARLHMFRLGVLGFLPAAEDALEAQARAVLPAIRARQHGARGTATLLLGIHACRLDPSPLDRDARDFALDVPALIAEQGTESPALGQLGFVLASAEELDRLEDAAARLLHTARARGSVHGVVTGSFLGAYARTRRGDLVTAEAELRLVVELSVEHGMPFVLPSTLHACADCILERDLDDLAAVAALVARELEPSFERTLPGAMLQHARGRLLLRAGRLDEALPLLRAAADRFEAGGWLNPTLFPFHVDLALALARAEPDEAAFHASAHDRLAQQLGTPREIGIALRTRGIVAGGPAGIELLVRAVAVLRASPARLELARALVELGAALRRSNQRAGAREPLREGLDLARRCGAWRTGQRARTELAAAGGRVRREALSGVDSLTPSQRRVADLAASGLSNPQIAQALFVTRNTVETHLRAIFTKLAISRRSELVGALQPDARAAG